MNNLSGRTTQGARSFFFASTSLLLTTGLLLLICTGFGSVQPISSHSNTAAPFAKLHDVPFHAKLETTITISGPPPVRQVRSAGFGTATHLGKTSFEVEATVNVAIQPAVVTGTATFTAANGDQFFTSFSGTTRPDNGAIIGDFMHEVTGGTGRFSDITGSFTGHSVHPLALQSGSLIFDGTISY
jgi:hypothetical protein